MAWLQNLAGKAEDFLNKIDQNAATVLNEPNETDGDLENAEIEIVESDVAADPIPQFEPQLEIIEEIDTVEEVVAVVDIECAPMPESPKIEASFNLQEEFKQYPPSLKSETNSSKASSFEEQFKYDEQINKLELDNQELNKQILNWQHRYSELQNEYRNMQAQLERSNESALQAFNQMEEYKVRAHRILQEKEKLIHMNQNSDDANTQNQIIATYNEEIKKELQFQQYKNNEITMKLNNQTKELLALQQQYVAIQNNSQQSNQNLHETWMKERKVWESNEEDYRFKLKEMQALHAELNVQHNLVKTKEAEVAHLKQQLKQSSQRGSDDNDIRLNSLTHTLMHKQNTLEMMTSERNALKIQLEKLESSYNKLLNQKQHTYVNVPKEADDETKSQVPRLMQVSPLDAGVTRRVKHAYSTLDTISIRTGAFLRRYPTARIFVFCYMILLHIWVLIILFTYVPMSH